MRDPRDVSITIVVPSYNQGQFCRDTLESLRSQNWPDLQVIFVDGGSTDNTLEIVSEYSQLISELIVEKDEGAADAINKGFERARGELVGWLNTDDFYYPHALETWARAYLQNPEASFYAANGHRVDIKGKPKEEFFKNGVEIRAESLAAGLDYVLQPSTIINGECLSRVGFLDRSLRWGFDWDLFIRLGQAAKPVGIDEIVAVSREYEGTLTASGGQRRGRELLSIGKKHSGVDRPPGGLIYNYQSKLETAQSKGNSEKVKEFSDLIGRELPRLAQLGLGFDGLPFKTFKGQFERVSQQSTFERVKILIDFSALVTGTSGGIVTWTGGVLEKWLDLFRHHEVILFKTPHLDLKNFPRLSSVCIVEASFENRLNELRNAVDSFDPTIVVRAYPDIDMDVCELNRQIVFVPDMQHEFFPENFERQVLADRRMGFARTLRGAGSIVTLTNHSKRTIDEFEATCCDDVFIAPAASPEELDVPEEEINPPASLPKSACSRYFYFPANIWPHKNHKALVRAFSSVANNENMEDVHLVLSGHPGDWDALKKESKAHARIIHVGFVTEGEKAWLLQNAIAVTYFSLFEGFGIPILEAFIHGTPVLAGDVTSIPEVGGDALVLCDPTDEEAIASLIVKAAADPEGLRKRTQPFMKQQLNRYHWSGAALEFEAGVQRLFHRIKTGQDQYRPMVNLEQGPLVTIVTPSYNQGQFISATLDSVLEQSYRKIQHIVMDGGSTDNTVEILKAYEEKYREAGLEYKWVSEKDKGQTNAINKGMAQAEGKILCYLNSDDVLLPNALESVVPYFVEDMNLGLIYGEANYIDADGTIIGNYNIKPYNWNTLLNECCICQPAAFWTRELREQIGEFDEAIENSMDYEFWLRAGAKSELKTLSIPFFLAQSRIHEDVKTLKNRRQIFSEIFKIVGKYGEVVGFGWHIGYWSYLLNEGGLKWVPKTKHHWWFVLPAAAHMLITNVKLNGFRKGWRFFWNECGPYIYRRFGRSG